MDVLLVVIFFRRVRGSLASLLLLVFCSVLGNVAHGCIKLYCKQRIPVAQLEWPSLLGNRASRLWCQRRSENEKIPDSALMSMRRPQRYHRNPLRLSCDHPWRDAWSRGRSLSVANGVHFYTHNPPPPKTHTFSRGAGKLLMLPAESRDRALAAACATTTENMRKEQRNNCADRRALKRSHTHLSRQRRRMRSLCLKTTQVCTDIFLRSDRCYVTQRTICCVHSSICQKLQTVVTRWIPASDPNRKTAGFTQAVRSSKGLNWCCSLLYCGISL